MIICASLSLFWLHLPLQVLLSYQTVYIPKPTVILHATVSALSLCLLFLCLCLRLGFIGFGGGICMRLTVVTAIVNCLAWTAPVLHT